MAQMLIEKCDRCNEQVEHFAGETEIRWGSGSLTTKLFFDLCSPCLSELRTFLNTKP